MKKRILSIACLLFIYTFAISQDEGTVVKRERIPLDKSIFVGGGISILGGSNVGDYTNGINFEGGFMKRLNRVLSLGASLSYLNFKYDPTVLTSTPTSGAIADYPNLFYDYNSSTGNGNAYVVNINNTNLTLLSLNANIKVNFVPIKDNTVISVYGFAKPFLTMAKHGDVNGNVDAYVITNDVWSVDQANTGPQSVAVNTNFTGGIFVGPGIEINPTKPLSFFAQASFGYTFPMDIISTKSYPRDISSTNLDRFPFVSDGFTSINFAAGLSFNID